MFEEPTIDDFSEMIREELQISENKSDREIQLAIVKGAAKGMSGNVIREIMQVAGNGFETGMTKALSRLSRSISETKLDRNLMRGRVVAELEGFVIRINNQIANNSLRIFNTPGIVKVIEDKQTELKSLLKRRLRQFDTGLFKPEETDKPVVDNSIKVQGNMTGSAIQQASPGAKQIVKADLNIFDSIKTEVEKHVGDESERNKILKAIDELRNATGNSETFISKYQEFIATASNHMTLIAPFLPALTKLF